MAYGHCFLNQTHWPSIEQLNLQKPTHTVSWIGEPIEFVLQKKQRNPKKTFWNSYEPRIFLASQVSTRKDNWHDFFNALIWYSFPKSKAALNMRQFIAFDENTPFPWLCAQKKRLPEQDTMTMFDEGGCVMIHCHHHDTMFLFGHALYERILLGDHDLSALAIRLYPDASFFTWNLAAQLAWIDLHLSCLLANRSTYEKSALFFHQQIV